MKNRRVGEPHRLTRFSVFVVNGYSEDGFNYILEMQFYFYLNVNKVAICKY